MHPNYVWLMKQEASVSSLPDLNWNFQGYVDIPGLNIGPVGLFGVSSSYDPNTNISYTKVTAAHLADDWNTFTDISSPYFGDYLSGEASSLPQWTLNGGMIGLDPFSGIQGSIGDTYTQYTGIAYRQSDGTVGTIQDNTSFGVWSKLVYDNQEPPQVASIERSDSIYSKGIGQHTAMGLNQYIPYTTKVRENYKQLNNTTGVYEAIAPQSSYLNGVLKFNADDVDNTVSVLRYTPERSSAFYQVYQNASTPVLPIDSVPVSVQAPDITMTLKDGSVIPGRTAVVESFEFYLPGCVRAAADITITNGGSGILYGGLNNHTDVYFMVRRQGNITGSRVNQEEIPIVFKGEISGGVLINVTGIAIPGAGYLNSGTFTLEDLESGAPRDVLYNLIGSPAVNNFMWTTAPTVTINVSENYAMLKGCLFKDLGTGYYPSQLGWDNIIANGLNSVTASVTPDIGVTYTSATDGGGTKNLLTRSSPTVSAGITAALPNQFASMGLQPADTPNADDMFVHSLNNFGGGGNNTSYLYKNGFAVFDDRFATGEATDPHRIQRTAKMVPYSLDEGQTTLWTEYPGLAASTNNVGCAFKPQTGDPSEGLAIEEIFIGSPQIKNIACISSGKKGVYYVLQEHSFGTYDFTTSLGDYNHRLSISKLDFGAGPYDATYTGTPTWSINQWGSGTRNTGQNPIGVVGASSTSTYVYGYTATDTYCNKMLLRFQQATSLGGSYYNSLMYITFVIDPATGNISNVQIFDESRTVPFAATAGVKWNQVFLNYDSRNDRWVAGIDNTSGSVLESQYPNEMVYMISDTGLPHPGYPASNWSAITESDIGINDFWVGE